LFRLLYSFREYVVFKGVTKTCGCSITKNRTKEEAKKRKENRVRFSNMISRCYNEEDKYYKNYGGRGIKICDEWLNDRESFLSWCIDSGYKSNLTIDRIDNDKGYSPENCRWVTIKDNSRNRSNSVLNLEIVNEIRFGKYKNLSVKEIASILNCSTSIISDVKYYKKWLD